MALFTPKQRKERYRKRHPERVKATQEAYNKRNAKKNSFRTIFKKYGLTFEEWHALLISQSGRCSICRWGMTGDRGPCIDHVHVDNFESLPPEEKKRLIRGMTCHSCNVALGLFKDSIEILESAIQYLRKVGA